MASEFPLLGIDTNQIAMVAVSFAQQFEFFNRMADRSQDQSFFSWLCLTFGLIGFCYIILMREAWNVIIVGAWCLLFLILMVGPYAEKAFFVELSPNHPMMRAPVDQTGTFLPSETGGTATSGGAAAPQQSAQFREVLQQGPRVSDLVGQNTVFRRLNPQAIMAFAPQAAALHIGNLMQRALVMEFMTVGQRSLTDRLGAIEAIRMSNTMRDPRVIYDMTAFRAVCGRAGADGQRAFLNRQQLRAALEDRATGRFNNSNADYARRLQNTGLTARDVFTMYQLFQSERNRQPGVSTSLTTVLPPLIRLDGGTSQSDMINRLNSLSDADIGALNQMSANDVIPARRNARGEVTSSARIGSYKAEEKWRAIMNDTTSVMNNFENQVRSQFADRNSPLSQLPIRMSWAYINDDGRIAMAEGWLGRFFEWIGWTNRGASSVVRNCLDMQIYVMASANKAVESQAQMDRRVGDMMQQAQAQMNRQGQNVNLYDYPPDVRLRIAMETLREANRLECASFNQQSNEPRGEFQGAAASLAPPPAYCTSPENMERAIVNAVAAQMAGAAESDVDNMLRRAIAEGEFSGSIRNISREAGQLVAPMALFFKGMFGGFATGTYAGIAPYILAWAIGLIIMLTPFIYMIGLLVPMWAPSILITPILALFYFKMVEVSFVLIKGVFRIFNDYAGRGLSLGDSGMTAMQDILLGTAYTSAFAIAMFLMFGLKDPAGLMKQVAGTADKTAQISAQEAMGMVTATLGAAKFAAALIPGVGKVAGAAMAMAESASKGGDGGDGGSGGVMNTIGNFGKALTSPVTSSIQAAYADGYSGVKKSKAEKEGKIAEMGYIRDMESGMLPSQRTGIMGDQSGKGRTLSQSAVESKAAQYNKMAMEISDVSLSQGAKNKAQSDLESTAEGMRLDKLVGKIETEVQQPDGSIRKEKMNAPIQAVASKLAANSEVQTLTQGGMKGRTATQVDFDATGRKITNAAMKTGAFSDWDNKSYGQLLKDYGDKDKLDTEIQRRADQLLKGLKDGTIK